MWSYDIEGPMKKWIVLAASVVLQLVLGGGYEWCAFTSIVLSVSIVFAALISNAVLLSSPKFAKEDQSEELNFAKTA